MMTVGQLAINGTYNQSARGSITFDITGATPGQYDQLNISGHTQLNGLMTVDLIGGFVPQVGNTFDIINFASGSGSFSTVLGLPINSQEHFVLEYNSNNLTLDVVQGPGHGLSAVGNGSSLVEPYITSGGSAVTPLTRSSYVPSATTPEPSSMLLFVTSVGCLAGVLRNRHTNL